VLQSAPEYEAMFYLVHELRHAEQYQHPERFDAMIRVSLPYVVLYDGTCFRLRGETWQECRLDGGEERFRDAYLGFPYEVDANEFAAQRVKAFAAIRPRCDSCGTAGGPKRYLVRTKTYRRSFRREYDEKK